MPYKKKSRKAQVTDAAPDTPPMITSSPVKQEEGSAAVAPNLPTAQTGAAPLPAETAPVQASAAPQDAKDYEEIDSLGFITIGSHTVASPFTVTAARMLSSRTNRTRRLTWPPRNITWLMRPSWSRRVGVCPKRMWLS